MKNDRLKDVAFINGSSLPASTDPDYEFDYLEISNVDYHGVIDPQAIERLRYEDARHEREGVSNTAPRLFRWFDPICRPSHLSMTT